MADYPCKQRELQNRAALQSGLGIDLLRLLQRQRVGQIHHIGRQRVRQHLYGKQHKPVVEHRTGKRRVYPAQYHPAGRRRLLSEQPQHLEISAQCVGQRAGCKRNNGGARHEHQMEVYEYGREVSYPACQQYKPVSVRRQYDG